MLVSLLVACAPDPGTASAEDTAFDEVVCEPPEGVAYLEPPLPNVMLAVDRSGSMGDDGKWESLMAMTPYLEAVEASSNLGLTLYPSDDDCEAEITVPISDSPYADDAIVAALEASTPGGGTPIAEALKLIRTEGEMQDPDRDNVVVLVTDGKPSCSDRSAELAHDLATAPVPIKLHVLGFGSGADQGALAAIAEAAEVSTGPDNLYMAADVEDLLGRLDHIAASLPPCDYTLEEQISAETLEVRVAGELLEPCDDDDCDVGYLYDEALGVVTLAPVSCRLALAGDCPDVAFDGEAP